MSARAKNLKRYAYLLTQHIQEQLRIQSTSPQPPTKSGQRDAVGRPIMCPPKYMLQVEYGRRDATSKAVLSTKRDKVVLGHLGTSLY